MMHSCPSCGLFGWKVRRRAAQARRTAEAGLVVWSAKLAEESRVSGREDVRVQTRVAA